LRRNEYLPVEGNLVVEENVVEGTLVAVLRDNGEVVDVRYNSNKLGEVSVVNSSHVTDLNSGGPVQLELGLLDLLDRYQLTLTEKSKKRRSQAMEALNIMVTSLHSQMIKIFLLTKFLSRRRSGL